MGNAYKLVISEKPSVGKSIAAVLGANERKDGYFMGSGYIVSWCFGHLAELAEAAAYDEKYAKWRYDDLPILPESWQYSIARDKAKQFALLNTLMHRADVSEVINACDAGREGESIFRTVYMLNKCDKPMKRLWISSMEDTAIRKGFETLKDGSAYDDLYASALCRSKADWLVGINATRLFSVLYHRALNVGRVVSPTLALIVQREAEIDAFKSEPFYTVTLGLPEFEAGSERMKSKADAEALSQSCTNQTAMVTKLERKDKSEKPPALYDLTALQRDANRILGFTAQQTLDYLQSLYEKKLCTYPRTDSRYLTSDMADGLPALVSNVAAALPKVGGVPIHVKAEQVINNKKVSDHHAVIPTANFKETALTSLPAGERAVLELVALRLLCAVAQPHEYTETAVTLECAGHSFSAKGRTVASPGWRALMEAYYSGKDENKSLDAAKALPPVDEGQTFTVHSAAVKEGKTTPPKHYTDAFGKRRTKWVNTGLPVRGNKKKAEAFLMEERKKFQTAEPVTGGVLFADYIEQWLEVAKPTIAVATYASYCSMVKRVIAPYFRERRITLQGLTPKDIQDFYLEKLKTVSASSVIHYHANIHRALKHAVKLDLIPTNPADKVDRPKKDRFIGNFYDAEEVNKLFEVSKGTKLEFPILFGAFYGLRRSEALGLKWDAIDFENDSITIRHTVTSVTLDGKVQLVAADTTKTKSSLRTLPLVPFVKERLLVLKKEQENNRRLCGRSYHKQYAGYVCINEMGDLIKPHYVTEQFPKLLDANGLRRIRFHDLRHSCASLMLANGVPMKQIQDWLGHSDFSTTANIYAHLDYSTKLSSADAMLSGLGFQTEKA